MARWVFLVPLALLGWMVLSVLLVQWGNKVSRGWQARQEIKAYKVHQDKLEAQDKLVRLEAQDLQAHKEAAVQQALRVKRARRARKAYREYQAQQARKDQPPPGSSVPQGSLPKH